MFCSYYLNILHGRILRNAGHSWERMSNELITKTSREVRNVEKDGSPTNFQSRKGPWRVNQKNKRTWSLWHCLKNMQDYLNETQSHWAKFLSVHKIKLFALQIKYNYLFSLCKSKSRTTGKRANTNLLCDVYSTVCVVERDFIVAVYERNRN